MCQTDLTDCGGGLAFLEPQRSPRQPELPPPECDGSRGHQDELLAALAHPHQILDEGLQPTAIESAGVLIDQQRRPDLHHDAAGGGERRIRAEAARDHGKTIRDRRASGDFGAPGGWPVSGRAFLASASLPPL